MLFCYNWEEEQKKGAQTFPKVARLVIVPEL